MQRLYYEDPDEVSPLTLPSPVLAPSNRIDEMENGEWRNGLFSHVCGGDCGTCVCITGTERPYHFIVLKELQMAAWWCPCFLYGRVSQRLDQNPNDDTPGMCNGPCWLMCGASCLHLHWLVALFKRGDTRNKFGVKGDGCTDCLVRSVATCSPFKDASD